MPEDGTGMLGRTRAQAHPGCAFCGTPGDDLLGLAFREDGAGGVIAHVDCRPAAEGYPGLVHGGIASGFLDAAMTNALFAHGVAGLTGRLSVRYRRPLRLAMAATVHARVTGRRGSWWTVQGEIRQEGQAAIVAEACFRDREG